MNLIEAVKTGKPFRRKCWFRDQYVAWEVFGYAGSKLFWQNHNEEFFLNSKEEILADDYEVLENPTPGEEG